jgi:hypothetical protein
MNEKTDQILYQKKEIKISKKDKIQEKKNKMINKIKINFVVHFFDSYVLHQLCSN